MRGFYRIKINRKGQASLEDAKHDSTKKQEMSRIVWFVCPPSVTPVDSEVTKIFPRLSYLLGLK